MAPPRVPHWLLLPDRHHFVDFSFSAVYCSNAGHHWGEAANKHRQKIRPMKYLTSIHIKCQRYICTNSFSPALCCRGKARHVFKAFIRSFFLWSWQQCRTGLSATKTQDGDRTRGLVCILLLTLYYQFESGEAPVHPVLTQLFTLCSG